MNKSVILILALVTISLTAIAQAPPPAEGLVKMKSLIALAGTWKGNSTFSMGGPERKSFVEEHLVVKLGGLVLMMEGSGKATDTNGQEKIVHNALGLLTWNNAIKDYQFSSWLADGRSTQAYWKIIDETHFEWGFDVNDGKGKMKYSITIDPALNTWNEIGNYAADGSNWKKFFEMNLIKE